MPSFRFRLVQGKYRGWYVTDVVVISGIAWLLQGFQSSVSTVPETCWNTGTCMCALTFESRNGLSLHYKFSRAWNCVAYIPAFHTALHIFMRFATQCVANFLVLSTSVLQFPVINTVLHVSCTWHCATSYLNLTLDRSYILSYAPFTPKLKHV